MRSKNSGGMWKIFENTIITGIFILPQTRTLPMKRAEKSWWCGQPKPTKTPTT